MTKLLSEARPCDSEPESPRRITTEGIDLFGIVGSQNTAGSSPGVIAWILGPTARLFSRHFLLLSYCTPFRQTIKLFSQRSVR